ncbi:hypothetical protein ABZS66_11400 [Dactylosporangium sp. NPDC005572]|uniref:LysM peptidoglycan-binding domain-containing protein n=1 Tax=Dactylosporangium sp. NPDC005572 TaxID=3156889 RepID=UPI00339F9BF0
MTGDVHRIVRAGTYAASVTAAGILVVLLTGMALLSAAAAAPSPAGSNPSPAPSSVAAPGPAPGPASKSPAGNPYYVVGTPVAGQPEFLYLIAVKTLGDGNRYPEIFELNRGRPQSDGRWMTDPLRVEPGWILMLPPDAHGPEVRFSPLPPTTSPAEPTSPPAEITGGGPLRWLNAAALVVLLLAMAPNVLRCRRRPLIADDAAQDVVEATPVAPPLVRASLPEPLPARDELEPRWPEAVQVGAADELRAELDDGIDRIVIHLRGARGDRGTPAYAWLDEGHRLAGATMPVVLGIAGRRLWADLARTPDVLTISGPLDACRRQALSIAEQLHGVGRAVIVVGDVISGNLPLGWHRIDRFPSVDATEPTQPTVVISGGLRGTALRAARQMVARSGGSMVPLLIGDVLRASWSIIVDSPSTEGGRQ